ncbi:MAG: hypothetical protein QM764_08845 [Chitinophagaceae bacterium]
MKKLIATCITGIVCLLLSVSSFSQLTIEGQTCVLSGTEYQYNLKGDIPDGSQICVSGGTITGVASSCTSALGAGYVRVTWTDKKGSISLKSGQGNQSLDVVVTTPLDPGTISSVKAELISFKASCSAISCGKPNGGGCNATYSFQWQRSLNNLVWEDIKGATGQNLGALSALTDTYFYRRRVTENNSKTVAYSDATVVYVSVDMTGH